MYAISGTTRARILTSVQQAIFWFVLVGETAPPHSHLFSVSINEGYGAASLIRNTHPPRITLGPLSSASAERPCFGLEIYRGTSLIRNTHPTRITMADRQDT